MVTEWIRNEWLLVDGTWSQTGLCMRNKPDTDATMRLIMRTWPRQWIESENLVLGLPHTPNDSYFVAFSKKEF